MHPLDLHGQYGPPDPDPGPVRHGLRGNSKRSRRPNASWETKTFQALERGEANPLVAPEVSEAVQKAKEAKEVKEKNYQAIAAIREKIRSSCVIPTPKEPGGIEENPPCREVCAQA